MQFSTFLSLAALSISIVQSLPSNRTSTRKTLYFQGDDPAGNDIIALRISDTDGTISNPIRTSTGGRGLANLVAVSQDSVVVSGNVCISSLRLSHLLSGCLFMLSCSTSSPSIKATRHCPCLSLTQRTPNIRPWLGNQPQRWARHLYL